MAVATISAGQTTSAVVDLSTFLDIGRQRACGLFLPAGWTAGSISFLASNDLGVTYQPIYNAGGTLYTVTAPTGGYVPLDLSLLSSISNFKIVSSVTQANAVSVGINLGIATASGFGGANTNAGNPIPVSQPPLGPLVPSAASSTSASIGAGTANANLVQVFAAQAGRASLLIQNTATSGNLTLYAGSTAATASPFFLLAPGGFYQTAAAETAQAIFVSGSAAAMSFIANQTVFSNSGAAPLTTNLITVPASGAAQTLNFAPVGDVAYDITLSQACTISLGSPPVNGTFQRIFLIIRPAGYQTTLPPSSSSIAYAGGSPPVVSVSGIFGMTIASTGTSPALFGF